MGWTVRGAGIALASVAVLVGSGGAAAAGDPPGNNGTVKVDGVEFDDHPDNQPHVGCVFQIDFAGFDEGDLQATVTFEVVPPTLQPPIEILNDELDIGQDPAGGATDNDASGTYDLSDELQDVVPKPPQQGIHLRLTVHAEGSIGADTKFKEFWVQGCGAPPPTTSTTEKPGNGSTTTTEKHDNGSTTTTEKHGNGDTTTTAGIVPGDEPETPGPAPSVSPTGGELPNTGSNATPLVLAGVVLALVGAGTAIAARQLRAGRTAP